MFGCSLQPMLNEVLHYKTGNKDDGARLDVALQAYGAKRYKNLSLT